MMSAPMSMMANVMDNIQHDPQGQQLMLGMGVAYDVMKSTPVNLFANIPHFEFEVDNSDSSKLPWGTDT